MNVPSCFVPWTVRPYPCCCCISSSQCQQLLVHDILQQSRLFFRRKKADARAYGCSVRQQQRRACAPQRKRHQQHKRTFSPTFRASVVGSNGRQPSCTTRWGSFDRPVKPRSSTRARTSLANFSSNSGTSRTSTKSDSASLRPPKTPKKTNVQKTGVGGTRERRTRAR